MNTVLLLTDHDDSWAALDWALDHARVTSGTLHVVAAAHDAAAAPTYVSPHYLDEVTGRLEASGVDYRLCEQRSDPAAQVVDLVEAVNADLAVVGLRARSATLKFILGSHAQKVVLGAACPVVTVKARLDKA